MTEGQLGGDLERPPQAREFPTALMTLVVVAAVVVVVIALVVVKAADSHPPPARSDLALVPRSVLSALTSLPRPLFDAAGAPGQPSVTPPTVLDAQPALAAHGRPTLVWVGAEFCPTCAAERWAVVVALDRFGRFSGLDEAWSAPDSLFPHLPTFSLEHATYRSSYVSLSAVEEYGSTLSTTAPGGYVALSEPAATERALMRRYAPAVRSASPATLPFVDVANHLVVLGSTFSPGLLEGLTVAGVAADLAASASCVMGTFVQACAVAEDILGSANELDAGLCAAGARDKSVCSSPAVDQASRLLGLPH